VLKKIKGKRSVFILTGVKFESNKPKLETSNILGLRC
jgi:hypothetical protein